MKYSICKEIKPSETVKKIKNIIKGLDIDVEEFIVERKIKFGLSIVAVHLKYKDIPLTNGKGTGKANALASAYGELMERVQNQIIFDTVYNGKFNHSPDEIIIPIENIKDDKFFTEDKILIDVEKDLDKQKTEKTIVVPFYSLKSDSICNIPIKTLLHVQMSNGMSAGNTKEEAMVQGLSEICERYAIRELWLNKISMPKIPKEVYEKYTNIKEIIKYYESKGFSISIKDASIGKKLPVICVQIEDKENDLIHLSFGAHPCMPVAIERCLTEFIQCRQFEMVDKSAFKNDTRFFSSEYFEYLYMTDIKSLITANSMRHIAFENNKYIRAQFLAENETYSYTGESWIPFGKKTDNKKLLDFLLTNIKEITKNNIYVRDVSYLDFPALYIFIPEISALKVYDKERAKGFDDLSNWYNSEIVENSSYDNIDSLLSALEFRIKNRFGYDMIPVLSIPEEYLALLCAIEKNDVQKINTFVNILLKNKNNYNYFPQKTINLFATIKDYFNLKERGLVEAEIEQQLQAQYNEQEFKYAVDFIKNLKYDLIKKLMKNNKIISPKYLKMENHRSEILTISKNLAEKYENKKIEQEKLRELFKLK